jgi:hypothetical protein
MPSIWWRKHFNLTQHGDPYEKLWWPKLRHEFAEYEEFWKSHIVPLTNRIDPKFQSFIKQPPPVELTDEHREWVAIRDDPKLDSCVEKMAMAQYSVFYYFARASLTLEDGDWNAPVSQRQVYVEDTVLLLDLSQKNLKSLLEAAEDVFNKLQVTAGHLNNLSKLKPPVRAILRYRNALAHTPRLSRIHDAPEGHIPKWDKISVDANGDLSHSWRSMQKLPKADFVEPRATFRQLREDLLQKMVKVWRILHGALNASANGGGKLYRELYNLDDDWCIPGTRHPLAQPSRLTKRP